MGVLESVREFLELIEDESGESSLECYDKRCTFYFSRSALYFQGRHGSSETMFWGSRLA